MSPDLYFRNDGAVLVKNNYRPSFIMHNVHSEDDCAGEYCVLHNPSNHLMRDFDLLLRETTLMERVCSHGVGHPDPDSLAYFTRNFPGSALDIHGCCGYGCCMTDEEWRRIWDAIPDESIDQIIVKGKGNVHSSGRG